MALRITRGPDNAPLDPLRDRVIAVVGYGNQGRAHALNLRDSSLEVVIGSRPESAGGDRARADEFDPRPIPDAVAAADLVILALPDEHQGEIYADVIAPAIRPGAILGFLHGFAIRYEQVRPAASLGVVMVAPKGPGTTLRKRYVEGRGIPCLFAVEQDSPAGDAEAVGLAWAAGIGCARAGIIHTTLAAECETDLFGEQSVLVGGMTALILAAFETLLEAGYPPELAYVECCHEAKQIADLVYERGLAEMMKAISNTAEFGAYHTIERLDDDHLRATFRRLLAGVRDGSFAERLLSDRDDEFRWFRRQREKLARHPIEPAGKVIRALMVEDARAPSERNDAAE